MIRIATLADRSAIKSIIEAVGFEPAEIDTVLSSFDSAFVEAAGSIWLVDDDSGVQGVAYTEAERMTDRTHNLLLVAVHPDQQKQGRGTALVKHAERAIAKRGGRILLIETMAIDDFAHVRQLYQRLGFTEEAQIRDFYADGYDKVIFWKNVTEGAG